MSAAPTAPPATEVAPRQLETPFGIFTVNVRDVVHFADGLPGFEQNRKFVLLSSPELAPLHVLHHVDGPAASFLAVDPRMVFANYRTVLSGTDRIRLGGGDERAFLWLALVTMDAGQGPSVNLRAPIVINPGSMLGFQVMPHNSLYPLRHPLTVGE